jgi:cytoskeletal protein RodZ
LKRQIFEASQSINSVVASLQTPSSSSNIKHPLSLPSDFSSSSSSKQHHRFDPTSFYELATLAAAHAAAAFHNNKAQNNSTFQDFANSLTTPTAV